ncbi:MAG: cell division protein FtsA [Erysipelotrichaceae bacterium]|jgi:cell division protein FtsA|nr:cell division protein FtsA [Erysipelotrichaceae bacterium]
MDKKQIYAALEIADHEIRLIIGEFYETRFNILRIERAKITGIDNKNIVAEHNVVGAIMKVVNSAGRALGFKIERVLMAIPSVHVERYSKRVKIDMEEGAQRVQLHHIQQGINEAVNYRPDSDTVLINIGCIKYITNGITSRKLPLDEVCDSLTMDVDLLFGDKNIVYSYARCVERAGLEILDVCLDSYAIAEEAAVFEQTVDKYVVLIDLARQNTTLSLFTHGRLVSCEILEAGYGDWIHDLCEQQRLSEDAAFRLIQNNCSLLEKQVSDSVIYIWSENGEPKQITEREVYKVVYPHVEAWLQMINEACAPIVENGNVRYLLAGEGFEIQGLEDLTFMLNAPSQIYVPQTIGARDCALVTCLGLFYSWKAQLNIRRDDRVCCDVRDVEKVVKSASKPSTDDESGFTKKLKSMLLSDK